MKQWFRIKLIYLYESTGYKFWLQVLKNSENLYLFLVFYLRILKTQIMLKKLGLKKNNLVLPLKTKSKLEFGESLLRIINPSICSSNNRLIGVARTTNGFIERFSDYAGRPIQPYRTRREGLTDGIIRFRVDTSGRVSNIEVLHTPSDVPNYQDPRIFTFQGDIYLVMTRMLEEKISSSGRWRSGVSIQKLGSSEIIHLDSPLGKGIEKNWIPIVSDELIRLLYGSNPISIIELQDLHSSLKFYQTNYQSKLVLNNRSQMVNVGHQKFTYVRLASRKFANFKYGYTPFHYFELLSQEFKPLALSRPFVFSSIQMEICNSLTLDGQTLILAWTENEETNMIGTISLGSMLTLFSDDFAVYS